ncbi:MAG TPA: hypothetical protein VKW78_03080 [Terriglobales bacterium]|nr:hypothetical protein [Terriglobales bacterium]
MKNLKHLFLAWLLFVVPLYAGSAPSPEPTTRSTTSAASPATTPASSANAMLDSIVNVLATKGILSPNDVSALRAAPPDQQVSQLVLLLKQKGVITDSDVGSLNTGTASTGGFTAPIAPVAAVNSAHSVLATAVPFTPDSPMAPDAPLDPVPQTLKTAPGQMVIAAVAPIRVLPVGPAKREGLVPAIKVGGVSMTPYGFLKTSAIHDSSSPRGDDFPLPQFLFGDTGPNPSPEFHVKARSSRFGSNFEWLDKSKRVTVTGKVEADFEGNFSAVDNRNISSYRSPALQLRLAYGRIDFAKTDKTTIFGLFGQDWTVFGSSTLPNSLETTGLGIAFGTLYERDPQVRGGIIHKFDGGYKISGEIAAAMPSFGNVPSATNFQIPGTNPGSNVVNVLSPTGTVIGTVAIPQTPNTGLGLQNQLAFGERQGADSGRPELQGRAVFEWQLDKAPGVLPAQLIVSGMQAQRDAIVIAGSIPTAFKSTYPRGATVSSDKYGINLQAQLPTRWATLLTSWYRGADLRWYFAGQLFSFYNNTAGLTGTATAPSIDGSAAVVFGLRNGVPTIAPQEPVRTTGGFAEIGLPLSRWFNANPEGRMSGWTANFHYGEDQAYSRDVRVFNPAGARQRSQWVFGNLQYKLNTWVGFGYEQSLYWTTAITGSEGVYPLWQGYHSREARDLRSEFATTFSF